MTVPEKTTDAATTVTQGQSATANMLQKDYYKRMIEYYPYVLRTLKQMQGINDTQSQEVYLIYQQIPKVLGNAFVASADQTRIKQWQQNLKITPIQGSSLEDRRQTILARIRGRSKLNTAMINTIVKTFTGGTAFAQVRDSVLYVKIRPPKGGKEYQFDNVIQQIRKTIPAHLGLAVSRKYNEWRQLSARYSWSEVNNQFVNWDGVLLQTIV